MLHEEKPKKDAVNMADGGAVEGESPIITYLRHAMMGKPATSDVNTYDQANSVDTSSGTVKGYAEGGAVMDPQMVTGQLPGVPALPGIPAPDTDEAELAKIAAILASQRKAAPAAPVQAPQPSEDEMKHQTVIQALKNGTLKAADGGVVDSSQLPGGEPDQESKLQTILRTIGMAGHNLMNSPVGQIASAVTDPVSAVSSLVQSKGPAILNAEVPPASQAASALTGGAIPAMPVQPPAPEPLPNPPPLDMGDKPSAPPSPAPSAPAASGSGPSNPLAQLGKFDPSSVTPGLNPSDRQALATNLNASQHSYGNYLAEALAGLGDAVSAKGGVRQNSLGDIFSMQTQQRQEALDNFDKARQAAVEHFTMKNQADQNLINNLKAKNELFVSPDIARTLGHPELAGKPLNQADLVIKTDAMKYDYANKMTERKQAALKNAAEEVDKALTHGGIAGTQKMMDAKSRLAFVHAQAIKNDPEAFGYSIHQSGN